MRFESTRGSIEHPMLKLGRVEELGSVSLTIFNFANRVVFVIKRSNQMANVISLRLYCFLRLNICTCVCVGSRSFEGQK